MSVELFIESINASPTYDDARQAVADFEPEFRKLPNTEKNRCRVAWKARQAELALIGEVKPHLRRPPNDAS